MYENLSKGKIAAKYLLHCFYPARCPGCDIVLPFGELFCSECADDMHKVSGDICMRCYSLKQACRCSEFMPQYERVCTPFEYSGSVRAALISLKKQKNDELVKFFAKKMAYELAIRFRNVNFDCIAFVPMHKDRQKVRGYNQSELLAAALSDETGIKLCNLLLQTKNSRVQHSLDLQQRKENICGIYEAESCENMTVLLVDDIITTGFTMSECAAVLMHSGAKNVYGIGVAKSKFNA